MGHLSKFDLQKFIDENNIEVFIETGTGLGSSLKYALSYSFKKIYSIEIMEELHKSNVENFKNYDNCILINKNSKDGLIEAITKISNSENVLYFLDAHFPGTDYGMLPLEATQDKNLRIPLESELEIIKNIRDISKDVFIIDDLRIYEDNQYEHGNWPGRSDFGGDGIDFIYNLFGDTHTVTRDLRDEGYIVLIPKVS